MTQHELAALWQERRQTVNAILAAPEQFKSCDQCRSISQKSLGVCPFCGCYRFKEDAETVRATASEMGARPYPLNSPVVPRVRFGIAKGPLAPSNWRSGRN